MGRIVAAVLQRAYEAHMEETGKPENACSHVPGVCYGLLWFTMVYYEWFTTVYYGLLWFTSWIFVGFGL